MARPNKQGLDYFPFDVDFFDDEKIGAISGEFGIKGEITVVKLLCAVYRNGYFILWNDALKMSLLRKLSGISLELLEQIVNRLVGWGFFDQSLFSSVRVLTSKGIQKRYFEAIKRRNQQEEYPYLLINVDNNSINACNNQVNVYKSTQSKGKEKKEKNNIPHNPPNGEKLINVSFDQFWELYDKKVGKKDSLIKKWLKLSDKERESAMSYIPKYKLAQPNKKYRKNPESFLNQKAWNDELIFDEQSSFLSMPNLLQDKPKDGDRNDKGEIWSDQLQRWLK